ncbi:MAG TPA: hypothetical protein VKB10_03900 [Gaiellaceae bacterium]|nr:hypothetical protein [Gaiellaceae bacterium]
MTRGFLRFLRGNTIALLALFIALGGTTYAASTALIGKNTVASPQVVNGSLQTKDLSKKTRKTLKGSRGLRGLQGARGLTGATGAQGVPGTAGAAGTAVAYAHVLANGTVDAANSKNIANANIAHPAAGIYCFSGLSFTIHSVVTTPDAYGPTDGILVNPTFHGTPPFGGCASGVNGRVRTTTVAAPSTPGDHPFYIWFE